MLAACGCHVLEARACPSLLSFSAPCVHTIGTRLSTAACIPATGPCLLLQQRRRLGTAFIPAVGAWLQATQLVALPIAWRRAARLVAKRLHLILLHDTRQGSHTRPDQSCG